MDLTIWRVWMRRIRREQDSLCRGFLRAGDKHSPLGILCCMCIEADRKCPWHWVKAHKHNGIRVYRIETTPEFSYYQRVPAPILGWAGIQDEEVVNTSLLQVCLTADSLAPVLKHIHKRIRDV